MAKDILLVVNKLIIVYNKKFLIFFNCVFEMSLMIFLSRQVLHAMKITKQFHVEGLYIYIHRNLSYLISNKKNIFNAVFNIIYQT